MKKSLFLQLCPVCPFQQGMKLNIIRFINGFKAHGSVFGLTGGDIYVTTFVPKPIKYHILHIPHHSILSWCFICDNINNTKLRKMLILTSLGKCWKSEMYYDVALGNKGDIEKNIGLWEYVWWVFVLKRSFVLCGSIFWIQ